MKKIVDAMLCFDWCNDALCSNFTRALRIRRIDTHLLAYRQSDPCKKLCVNQAELVANCHLIGPRIFSHSLAKRVAC